jgi:lipopolysaccharide/colanic/teichoic acid biosynthesis glycosyltransferase
VTNKMENAMKRTFDIFVSFLAIILFFPIMLVICLLIVLETRGGVIYSQLRVGYKGKLFNIYKFRSMISNEGNAGDFYTKKNDSRITKVGACIRRTSLDELPQLFNVLKGDMSLVGPRPNALEQRSTYTEKDWVFRASVRPGITGLHQAILRSEATFEQRKKLDFEYIKKRSFFFDLYVIWLTALQMISKGGN